MSQGPQDHHTAARRRLDAALTAPSRAALLAEAEQRRRTLLRRAVAVAGGGLAVGAPTLALAPFLPFGFLGLAALIAGGIGAAAQNHLWRREVSGLLSIEITRAVGDLEHRRGEVGWLGLERLRELGLAQGWRGAAAEDVLRGVHRGVAFTMAEIHLFSRTTRHVKIGQPAQTSTSTWFRGLMFEIATPAPVPGRILLQGPRRLLRTPWRRGPPAGLTAVAAPDPAFAARFRAWADDPAAAVALITPGLAATLAALSRAAGGRGVDAAFAERSFLLLLPRLRDAFGGGSLLRPVGRLAEDAHRMLDDALIPHRLIDRLIDG